MTQLWNYTVDSRITASMYLIYITVNWQLVFEEDDT